ncbi:MAG TPA: Gfo/Idh/MocA family oxidoreductase [Candidatus Limnocylindrales bacterium]|nr:Gfo/Idh/MocA family oxidoreductase [Candidatus Limnocylindrales bacterium]
MSPTYASRDPDAIGIAVLGAGRMGRTHLRNLAAIPNARVLVVADPDGDAAERGRALAGARRAVTDPLEAIHASDVEAVVIVTPTSTHASLIEAALRAGRAIFSEKPIAHDLAGTARIVDLWRELGLPVQLGFMRRFDPGYVRARELIDAGALGRIEQFRALSRDTYPPSLEFLRTSGGSFLDMTIHDLDLARFLVGEVDEVQAWASVLYDERFAQADDWDTSLAMLRFANGALGVIETARHSTWGYEIRTEVAGAAAKVVIDAERKTPATLLRDQSATDDRFESFPDRFEVAYRRELEAFLADIAGGRMPSPGPDEALETLRLAVACTISWREARPVRVADAR